MRFQPRLLYSDELLKTRDAARMLGVRPRTLEFWRRVNKGPTYCRIGRAVRYSRSALQRYVEANEHLSSDDLHAMARELRLV